MSAPNIILKRNEPLEDEHIHSLAELVAYVAGYMDISLADAKQKVLRAIETGKFDEFMRRPVDVH